VTHACSEAEQGVCGAAPRGCESQLGSSDVARLVSMHGLLNLLRLLRLLIRAQLIR
jgi:hypothetical protein